MSTTPEAAAQGLHPQHVRAIVKERDGWREEAERLRKDNDRMRAQLDLRLLQQDRDCWFWQGDGADHPESFSNAMCIVIRGDQLRAIIAAPAVCSTCNGHGMVGGLLPGIGGYDAQDCPDCTVPQHLDANGLEAMAKARPDAKFLKGSGVLKLLGAIRTLEAELREVRVEKDSSTTGLSELARKAGAVIWDKDGNYGRYEAGGALFTQEQWARFCQSLPSLASARDEGFNAGTCVALAVVRAFDHETAWHEILKTAGAAQVMNYAAYVAPDEWKLGGFQSYIKRKPKKLASSEGGKA